MFDATSSVKYVTPSVSVETKLGVSSTVLDAQYVSSHIKDHPTTFL